MDEFTKNHLEMWLTEKYGTTEKDQARNMIFGFLREYPEMLDDHTWTEIRNLAEKYYESN